MKKWKHLMLLPVLISPVVLSSCQNIYAKKVEPKKVKTMSLQNKWIISTAKDFVKDYKKGNLENQIHTDDVMFSKYQEVPYFIYEAFKDLLFGQRNSKRWHYDWFYKALGSGKFKQHFEIVNEEYKEDEINFKNVFTDDAFKYLQSFVKLKDAKKVELNNVNKDSFKDKVLRLKKDKWVYSKTQDYIEKVQDTRTYDFENQRNSFLDNVYNTDVVKLGLRDIGEDSKNDLPYKFTQLITEWEKQYRSEIENGTKQITLKMIKDWFKFYYDYYKILNKIDANHNEDQGYSLLNVDKVVNIFDKKSKKDLANSYQFDPTYDYKNDTFKNEKDVIRKDDYTSIIQTNNEFIKGAKLRFSTNLNAKSNLATRNVQLFKDNTSQGSIALIDKNFQAYIITSRHSLYQRLVSYYQTKHLDEIESKDTRLFNDLFETKTKYIDLVVNSKDKTELAFQAQTMYDNDDYFATSINGNRNIKHNEKNTKKGYILDSKTNKITKTWDYTLTLLLNDYSKKELNLTANEFKLLYNPMWDHRDKLVDQVLIKVDLSKQPNEVKELLKQNRAYLNPMKLTSELILNDRELKTGNYVFNPQTYFINEDIKDNFKDIIKSENDEYNNVDDEKTYLFWTNKKDDKELNKIDKQNLSLLDKNKFIEDFPKYNSKDNLIQVYNNWQEQSFFKDNYDNENSDLINNGILYKGWDDKIKNNSYYQDELYDKKYRLKYLGIDLKQSEIFNVYDFISNQYYYTSSNVFHSENNYQKDSEGRNPVMSKIFLGYIYPGTSGTGLMNTKYEIQDDIHNKNTNDTDPNVFKDNYNVASQSNKTDKVAYDEMKYMIVGWGSLIDKSDKEHIKDNLVDFQNTPIAFGRAVVLDNKLVEKYNEILDELASK
ncbi:hypothetical protein RRG39_02570 [Mycoplasmopsis cynos]|uniref:hypothetical protein n=1 Tax=Mycoplasmopsis cynos TaxID=171284 RepID=UPI002AFFAED8|nr:hypothetical protein [Mycoplasmopsis cynos]WQQ16636.1 hypothetical protein RRG39_02570 [Mycoplasmopsis cynos]